MENMPESPGRPEACRSGRERHASHNLIEIGRSSGVEGGAKQLTFPSPLDQAENKLSHRIALCAASHTLHGLLWLFDSDIPLFY